MDEENKAAEETPVEVKEEVKEEEKVEEVNAEPKEEGKRGKGGAILAVVAVIILVILVAKLGGKKNPGPTTTPTPTPTQQVQVYKLGEKVTAGSAIVTVNKIQISKGTGKTVPGSGNEWLNVNLTIENTGANKADIVSTGTMVVSDSGGNIYQSTTTDKTSAALTIDGTVLATAKKSGWVGFEVPSGATGLQFEYNSSLFGGGVVVVDLGQ